MEELKAQSCPEPQNLDHQVAKLEKTPSSSSEYSSGEEGEGRSIKSSKGRGPSGHDEDENCDDAVDVDSEEEGNSASKSESSAWDKTSKVMGVGTVLETATGTTLVAVPSLGGGVIGGCATAAVGVATVASLATGVGVLAGLGVAGVQYAKRKKRNMKERKESQNSSTDQEETQEHEETDTELASCQKGRTDIDIDAEKNQGEAPQVTKNKNMLKNETLND